MADRFVLLIDILGFSELVIRKGRVTELYDIIDLLGAHSHKSFKTTVFSDTILIYNEYPFTTTDQFRGVVEWLCEFPQELIYRLIKLDLHFRAYLTRGEFQNSQLRNVQAFFGTALIQAHQQEQRIQSTGLFLDKSLLPYIRNFKTTPYNSECHFVHLMSTLNQIGQADEAIFPLCDLPIQHLPLLAYELTYLRNIYKNMHDIALEPRIRVKYAATWMMLENHHRGLMRVFEKSGFDPRSVKNADWSEAMANVGTSRGIYG